MSRTSTLPDSSLSDTSDEPPASAQGGAHGRLWQWLFALFAAGVLILIASRAREVDWPAVWTAVRAYGAGTLGAAVLLSMAGYLTAGSYDLLGKRYTRHRLPSGRVWTINTITYAFSLNLGALVGGWAFRVRLYGRHGVRPAVVAQVIALSVLTNWSGFVLLSGLILLLRPPVMPLPEPWALEPWALRAIGAVLLAAVATYVGACALGQKRQWSLRLRGVRLRLPSVPMALLQLALSSTSWLLMGTTLWHLLPGELPYTRVLAALFVCAVGGALLHVPGGLGVLEAGLTHLLADQVSAPDALAAALTFRALYYLLPFSIAAVAYLVLEIIARRAPPPAQGDVQARMEGNCKTP